MSEPDRLEHLRALRTANLDLAFATAFAALVGGNFLQAFALDLNAGPRVLALLAAVPVLLGVLQIPGALLGERFGTYKSFVAVGGFLWRLAWLPVVFLPLLSPSLPRLEILIGCIIFASAANFLVQATYGAWLSFLVPESHRGWYFSKRIAIATVVGVVIGIPASFALDWMTRHDDFTVGLAIVFGVGVFLGFVSFAFYMRMPNTPRASDQHPPTLRSLWAPLKDRRFRGLLLFLFVFVFAQMFAAPFFFPYGRQVLGLDFVTFQVFAVFHGIATLASAKMWGYLSDKYGNKPVLFLSGLLLCLGPFGWAMCDVSLGYWNYVILAVGHLSAGFSWTGVAVSQGNIILANTTPELRAQGLALSQAVIAIVGFLAQMAGGEVMQRTIGLFANEMRYEMLFVIHGGLRLASIFLLYFVKDASSTSLRGFFRQISRIRPKGVMAMRQLSSADNVAARQRAVRAIGESGMAMAEAELIAMLTDPLPRLRREAASALTRIGGEEAVAAMSNLIEKHPHLAEEEMVEAIAEIGNESAVPALVSLLQNPSAALRRASAKALGRLRSRKAIQALIQAASNQDDAELRRAAIQALRLIGDASCAPIVESGLRDSFHSVRIAAAEACAELQLTSCAGLLRKILSQTTDESTGEMAYALACVGDTSDTKLLLDVATRLRSTLARRRALIGVARLYGIEDDLYRLLMMDPVARDQMLMSLMQGTAMRQALSLFHSSKEAEALAIVAEWTGDPRIDEIARAAPKEGLLLCALLMQGA